MLPLVVGRPRFARTASPAQTSSAVVAGSVQCVSFSLLRRTLLRPHLHFRFCLRALLAFVSPLAAFALSFPAVSSYIKQHGSAAGFGRLAPTSLSSAFPDSFQHWRASSCQGSLYSSFLLHIEALHGVSAARVLLYWKQEEIKRRLCSVAGFMLYASIGQPAFNGRSVCQVSGRQSGLLVSVVYMFFL